MTHVAQKIASRVASGWHATRYTRGKVFSWVVRQKQRRGQKLSPVRLVAGIMLMAAFAGAVVEYQSKAQGEIDLKALFSQFFSSFHGPLFEIAVAVLLIDWLTEQRLERQEKNDLTLQMGSTYADVADEAVRRLRSRGWLADGTLKGANLWEANLRDTYLGSANLRGANLGYANLQGAKLFGADLQGAHLAGANLQGTHLAGANLRDAILWQADLQNAHLGSADFRGATLMGPDGMLIGNIDPTYIHVRVRVTGLSGADFEVGPTPSDFNLVVGGTSLLGANFRGAKISGADLEDALRPANLQYALLSGANLQGADLGSVDLVAARLEHANLQGANLQKANLQGADLWGAKLQGADLQHANLRHVTLLGANLQEAKNLDMADLTGIVYDKHTQWPAGFTLPPSARLIVAKGEESPPEPPEKGET
jgi:uncharacterized protein YjbI with pentapeptide repeats